MRFRTLTASDQADRADPKGGPTVQVPVPATLQSDDCPQPQPASEHGSEYAMLSRRVRQAGLLDPRLRYYTWKIAATALALVAGWTAFAVLGDSWWQLITAVYLAVVFTQLGFLGHDLYLYPHLSVTENLVLFARLYDVGAAQAAEALEVVGMSHKEDALVHTLSQGEGQRVALARAVLHDPDLLLVDEPFSGLDEASAAALPAVLKREGRTLVVATHDTERGKAIADRIVVLENGRISAA